MLYLKIRVPVGRKYLSRSDDAVCESSARSADAIATILLTRTQFTSILVDSIRVVFVGIESVGE